MRSAFAAVVAASAPRWTWLRCLVGLHEDLLLREPTRLSLVCLHCRRQTKGLALR